MARPVAYSGGCRTIVYAVLLDGSSPAMEFYDGLPRIVRNRFGVAFAKLGSDGKLFNKEQFKSIEGSDFYEFKCHRYRIICRFLDGGVVLLTNGCEKKKDKLDSEVIKRAKKIYEEDAIASAKSGGPQRHLHGKP
jgi:hypothetical protein